MEQIFSTTFYCEVDGHPMPIAYAWGPPDRREDVRAEAQAHLTAYREATPYRGPVAKREATFPHPEPLDIVRGGHRTPPRLRLFAGRRRVRRLAAMAVLTLALGCGDGAEARRHAQTERNLYESIARYYRYYLENDPTLDEAARKKYLGAVDVWWDHVEELHERAGTVNTD